MRPTANLPCQRFRRARGSYWLLMIIQCFPPLRSWMASFAAVLLCGLISSGCRSTGKQSAGGFASVVIQGNTPGQIRKATIEVFSEHGYKLADPRAPNPVFEKQASRIDNAAYGNWTGSPVWLRVKVAIIPEAEATFRLQCNAALLRDRGQPAFEEEIRLRRFQAGPYRKLLEEVAARLTGKPVISN
ncbi:MAG: hypothetical protein QOJ40_2521 [Verrucomicrobiota bacterium]